jgi:hypothetical protein
MIQSTLRGLFGVPNVVHDAAAPAAVALMKSRLETLMTVFPGLVCGQDNRMNGM